MNEILRITVPPPPSANHIWRTGRRGRHYRSRNYETWVRLCTLTCRAQPVACPVVVRIAIHGGKGWRATRDVDNAIKPIVDLLRHLGVIPDDTTEQVRRIEVEYHPPQRRGDAARCVVEVETRGEQ